MRTNSITLLASLLLLPPFLCVAFGSDSNPAAQTGFFMTQVENELSDATPYYWRRFTQITWLELQPAPGKWDWDDLDRGKKAIEAERAQGIHRNTVLVILTGESNGQWPPLVDCHRRSCPLKADENSYQAWKQFLAELFRRYAGVFDHWQIGNEYANQTTFFGGEVEDYLRILKAAQEAKSTLVAPQNCKIILGGIIKPQETGRCLLANEKETDPNCSLNAVKFQRKLLNRPDVYDIVDIHLFNYFRYNPKKIEDSIQGLRHKMSQWPSSKPIYVLEWSAAFGGFDFQYPKVDSQAWFKRVEAVISCTQDMIRLGLCHPHSQLFNDTQKMFETEQASDFVKMYVSMLEQGVEVNIHVQFADYSWDSPHWNYEGVIRRDPLQPKEVKAIKKPAYYNYLLTLEKLSGYKTIRRKTGLWPQTHYVYKVRYDDGRAPLFLVFTAVEGGETVSGFIDLSSMVATRKVRVTSIVTGLDEYQRPISPKSVEVDPKNVLISVVPAFVEQIP